MIHSIPKSHSIFRFFIVTLTAIAILATSFMGSMQVSANAEYTWVELQEEVDTPARRQNHSAVWDSTNNQMLMFGGYIFFNGTWNTSNDLWSYDPATDTWTELEPQGDIPAQRQNHSAVWDPINEQMLVLGGSPDLNPNDFFNDLHAYNPATNTWTELAPDGDIPVTLKDTAVWDSQNNQLLALTRFNGNLFGNLHAYNPTTNTWTELDPQGNVPASRSDHSAVWDPINNQVLVFGGRGSNSLNDLHTYDPATNTWSELEPEGDAPGERYDHSAVWDPTNNQMLVFGGWDGEGSLWSYNPTTDTWSELESSPYGFSQNHSAVWDPTNNQMLVFGGWPNYAALLSYNLATDNWSALEPGGGALIVRGSDHSAVWDPTNNQMLVFGGIFSTIGYSNDIFSYNPTTNTWTKLDPAGETPEARYGHSAVWDPINNQMLMFGGGGEDALNDLHAYNPATNTWIELDPQGNIPASRSEHTAVWDPTNNQMLVFGGYDDDLYSDIFSYSPTTNTWIELEQAPEVIGAHSAVWDPTNNQMLVFGGWFGENWDNSNDIFSYNPTTNTWTKLDPAGETPEARYGHSAVWDPINNQMLMFGGGGEDALLNDLHAYNPATNTWIELEPGGDMPEEREYHSAVWDSTNNQMLVLGGHASWGSPLNSLYALKVPTQQPTPTTSSSPTPTSVSTTTGSLTITPNQQGTTTRTTSEGSNTSLSIPQGALNVPTIITITPRTEAPSAPPNSLIIPGSIFKYDTQAGPNTTVGDPSILSSFNVPVTISITPPNNPDNPDSIQVHFYNETTNEWEPLPTTYDPTTNTFQATTTHFTLFALIETEEQEQQPAQVDLSSFTDGDLIRQEGTLDVYLIKIQDNHRYKRLILNPEIFNSYGHLSWNNIKSVSEDQLNAFTTSTLVIEVNPDGTPTTGRVYELSAEANTDTGIKRWLNVTAERFTQLGHTWASIFRINHREASPDFYPEGEEVV